MLKINCYAVGTEMECEDCTNTSCYNVCPKQSKVLFDTNGGDMEYHYTELFNFFYNINLIQDSTYDKCIMCETDDNVWFKPPAIYYVINNILEKNKDKIRLEHYSCNDEDGSVGMKLIRI